MLNKFLGIINMILNNLTLKEITQISYYKQYIEPIHMEVTILSLRSTFPLSEEKKREKWSKPITKVSGDHNC